MPLTSRRTFLHASTVAALALVSGRLWAVEGDAAPLPAAPAALTFGICGSLSKVAVFAATGADYLEDSVQAQLVPDQDDAAFAPKLAALLASPLPVRTCNLFIPSKLKATGPEAVPDKIVAFADIAFQRAKRAGIELITFGSGAARQVPAGFSHDEAKVQFIALLARLGPLAAAQGVTLAVEQLRAAECNFLNRIGEVAEVITRANHPALGITADSYHMAQGGDTIADLAKALPLVRHLHVAEKDKRSVPGVAGDDFRPLLRVLATAHWRGRLSIEANAPADEVVYRMGITTLRTQAREAGIG